MADKSDVILRAASLAQPTSHDHLTPDQLAAVVEFIKHVGGVDNAQQALAALVELKDAA